MTDEQSVRDALHAYICAVFEHLRASDFEFPPKEDRGSGWVASGDAFVLREHEDWQYDAQRHAGTMEGTVEYAAAIAALRAHPVIGPRLDTIFGGWTLEAGAVPAMLLGRMLAEVDDVESDIFDQVFTPLYEWLTRDDESVIVVAPLSGVASDEVPIQLATGVEIDRMTDDEVIACLTTRVIPSFGLATVAFVDPRIAIRMRERHPVDQGYMSTDPLLGRIEPIEAVVHALRLVKAGNVSVPGFVDMPEAPYRRAFRWTPVSALPHRPFVTYTLDASEVEPLRTLWAGLRDERVTVRKRQKALRTAIRRFGFAGERSRPDDQILDMMIAAEALFLAGEKTENRDKLSLRAALFLDPADRSPREVARFFRAAYDIRSTLAHGGEVDESDLPELDGAPASVEKYAEALGDYLRMTLRRMIEMVEREEPLPLHDWDDFTFGRLAPTGEP